MNSKELITMSQKELHRRDVIQQVCKRVLRQGKAATVLGISVRQIKRLCQAYRTQGSKGLISKQRGRISHHRLSEKSRLKIITLARKKYVGFGPTLMSEKLEEVDKLTISKESLRKVLISEGVWKPGKKRKTVIHRSRERRACVGELVQIDGSPHDWFEGRAPVCCLIVFIDDATSEVLHLRFEPVETTQAYFRGLFQVIQLYGLPLSLYSDKHSIFRVNQGDNPEAQTQFGRACNALGIELINAHSPQAKGRVERSNQTFQDRLVKELRLANISDRESANVFVEAYRKKHNARFAKVAREPQNAFISNSFAEAELIPILSEQETRKVSKNLELSFGNRIYQIQQEGKGRRIQQASVTVCRTMKEEIALFYQGKRLEYTVLERPQMRPCIVDEKSLNAFCDKKVNVSVSVKPAKSHPWRHAPISKKSALIYEQRTA